MSLSEVVLRFSLEVSGEAFERRCGLRHVSQALALGPPWVRVALHAGIRAPSWWLDLGAWLVGADGRILHLLCHCGSSEYHYWPVLRLVSALLVQTDVH